MNLLELGVYLHLLFCADFRTGIHKNSAPHIFYSTGQRYSVRQIQRALEALEKAGFIKRFKVNGRRGDYYILIHKFLVTDGAWKGHYLNTEKTTDWEHPVYEPRVDDDVHRNVENGVDSGDDDDVDRDVGNDAEHGEYVNNSGKNSRNNSGKTSPKNSPKKSVKEERKRESLSLPLSAGDETFSKEKIYTEEEVDELQKIETDAYRLSARTVVITVKDKLQKPYTSRDEEEVLPLFITEVVEPFGPSGLTTPVSNRMTLFTDWMMQKHPERILSVKDWVHHWTNAACADNGFRPQFEAWLRAVPKKKNPDALEKSAQWCLRVEQEREEEDGILRQPDDEDEGVVVQNVEVEPL
jgi:hypothetical protein